MANPTTLASLSLTHVYYDPSDPLSYLCAWLALLPQALCIVYATLVWSTREAEVMLAFAGQLGCEAVNFALKRLIKEQRPQHHHHVPRTASDTLHAAESHLSSALPHRRGYGMPSSHAQFAGYWAITICLFLLVRYRGPEQAKRSRPQANAKPSKTSLSSAWPLAERVLLSIGAFFVAVLIAWSRVYLHYHTTRQVLAGFAAGLAVGAVWFVVTALARSWGLLPWALALPPAQWLRLRDLAAEEDAAQAGWEKWQQRQAEEAVAKTR